MTDAGAEQGRNFYDETILSNPEILAGERITLHAERPIVAKRDVRGRLAILKRRTVTVRKTFEVDVMHEELQISYEDGDATEMLGVEPTTFSILLHAEDLEIVKHVRVVEEIFVSKKRVIEQERIAVTLRHETLDAVDAKRI